MAENIFHSINHFYPEIVIVLTLCAIIIGDFFLKPKSRATGMILLAGLTLSGIAVVLQTGWTETIFHNMSAVDPFALFFKSLILLTGIFITLFSMKSGLLKPYGDRISEYYMLLAGAILGMLLMAGATNILMIYLAFEMASISSYVLAGFTKNEKSSAEASIKYIIYGAVSSGVMIYGLSLLIGITGATDIYAIGEAISAGAAQPLILTLSVLMIIAGLGFKVAIVPFHFWAPDVYEGAPAAVAAFLAVASKLAAFALMIRFFTVSMSTQTAPGVWEAMAGTHWNMLLAVTAVLAMVIGNLTALRQNNIKRMLAYSSIAHAGYIIMGLVVMTSEGMAGIMIYALIYLFMNLGAFLVVILVQNELGTENISDYKGLGHRAPFLSISMTIFLVALTGFPPTAGFIAKIYIFGAAIHAGWIWLVLIAGLTTVISLFYYMRVVRNMFLYKPEGDTARMTLDKSSGVLLLLLIIPTLLFGVYFTPVIEFARNSIAMFGF